MVLRNRTLLAVSFAVCAAYTGIGMVVPVRVLYAQAHGASLAIIGAMASSYLISNFLFQYPGGWLADRWGRKPIIISSLLLQAIVSASYLLIADPILFVVVRFAEGAVAAAFLPSARALITDTIPTEKRGEAFGIFSAFFNVGFLLGPAIGGLVATSGYAAAFIGAVVFRLVAIAIVMVMIREPARSSVERKAEQVRVSWRVLFALPLLAAYLLAIGDYLYVGFDIALTPLWLHDHLGASVAMIGIAYMAWSVPSIIVSPFGGRVADRRRRSTMILVFGLLQVPLYVLYGLANVAILIAVGFAIHGILYSFMAPAVDAHLAAASSPKARARIQGLYSAFGMVGGFIGSTAGSILYAVNFRLPLFSIGAAFALAVLLGGMLIRLSEGRRLSGRQAPAEQEVTARIAYREM